MMSYWKKEPKKKNHKPKQKTLQILHIKDVEIYHPPWSENEREMVFSITWALSVLMTHLQAGGKVSNCKMIILL